MKPVTGALAVLIMGSSLSGCGYMFGDDGYFRDRGGDYQLATVEPRMEVPSGVQSKPLGDMLPVPGVTAPATADKFVVPRPQPMTVSADDAGFSLQQSGSRRWLLAASSPTELYGRVSRFFDDYQVPVADESSSLGEFETEWLAFDLQPSNPLVRRLAPSVGEGRRLEGREQRFRVRIEPGVQGANSEIHVLHMSRSQGGTQSEWPDNSDNSNLERALLAEMETYLNQSEAATAASLAVAMQGSVADTAELSEDGAGNPVLTIQRDFNRAWAAVGSAIGRADLAVADMNRSSGVYYVNLDQSASEQADDAGFFSRLFGRGEPEPESDADRVQVRLTQIGDQVQVTVERSIDSATDLGLARDLLTRIRDNLS
ncbi:outer membrane protein assembly factor BamC [Pseudomonas sp. gcc21]|uniref:outer membrane protein assembly factor BamC n=1 Tax=Pseudomonas sp. gcc21 TaxID=2726989 RepID=UPI0014512FB3|nr:outer membrane protein assembly factor BamC [Pseudomonas sp. gcc21]QJD57555.1 outer membrane protein assembly factor BamC [Pseudomonas sp. gcc21]